MTDTAFLDSPVLLLIFNRPETTSRVMECIRAMQPKALYVAADGPRLGRAEEPDRCKEARKVAAAVDWPCDVHTLYRDGNLGCGLAVSSGISWFFDHVPEGIVLEDDCVPSLSFFRFCTELLDRYRDEARVMHISGNSWQYGRRRGRGSYYFSKYPNVWGWATWRRAWMQYDYSLRPAWVLEDTWDTQWELSLEKAGGLSIVPNLNLVENIGYGSGATHTKGGGSPIPPQAGAMDFPLIHPTSVRRCRSADVFTYYAHHRMVRHHRLVWLYWLRDQIYFRLKPVKRWLMRRLDRT